MTTREYIAENESFQGTNIYELLECKNKGCDKLEVHDWLENIPTTSKTQDIIEVRFKNTRKEYFKNTNQLKLKKGDIVVVEASIGYDIGVISLTGNLVLEQLKKLRIKPGENDQKKIYRKAKDTDLKKWREAIKDEKRLLVTSREVAESLKLKMKIGDVEFQGDKTKAIFYYIADERVDFRELIKILADKLKIRIEMRQIGARQEAGRIGSIGPCGQPSCCTTWLSNFTSVTTNAARYQNVSMNPQKLAGQCGKLKCCLNYELESYMDYQKDFPNTSIALKTEKGTAKYKNSDILKRTMLYAYESEKDGAPVLVNITVERVKEIIQLNKKGIMPIDLNDTSVSEKSDTSSLDYKNAVGQDDLDRFDKKKKNNNRRKKNRKPRQSKNNRNERK
jgi:cell fate regulator YaaT (PSP1 superfamily)